MKNYFISVLCVADERETTNEHHAYASEIHVDRYGYSYRGCV